MTSVENYPYKTDIFVRRTLFLVSRGVRLKRFYCSTKSFLVYRIHTENRLRENRLSKTFGRGNFLGRTAGCSVTSIWYIIKVFRIHIDLRRRLGKFTLSDSQVFGVNTAIGLGIGYTFKPIIIDKLRKILRAILALTWLFLLCTLYLDRLNFNHIHIKEHE